MPKNVVLAVPSATHKENRLPILRRYFGDVEIVTPEHLDLKEDPIANLQAAINRVSSSGQKVCGVILPQCFFEEIGSSQALGGAMILQEDYVRRIDGCARVRRDLVSNREILTVTGYSRLVRAEPARIEPVTPKSLKVRTGRVLIVSKLFPDGGKQEALDNAFGQPMKVIVKNLHTSGRPREGAKRLVIYQLCRKKYKNFVIGFFVFDPDF